MVQRLDTLLAAIGAAAAALMMLHVVAEIFCRNVLIYFEEDDKRTIVENVLSTIRPGGLLVIGESESLLERDARLEYLEPCIFRVSK